MALTFSVYSTLVDQHCSADTKVTQYPAQDAVQFSKGYLLFLRARYDLHVEIEVVRDLLQRHEGLALVPGFVPLSGVLLFFTDRTITGQKDDAQHINSAHSK